MFKKYTILLLELKFMRQYNILTPIIDYTSIIFETHQYYETKKYIYF